MRLRMHRLIVVAEKQLKHPKLIRQTLVAATLHLRRKVVVQRLLPAAAQNPRVNQIHHFVRVEGTVVAEPVSCPNR